MSHGLIKAKYRFLFRERVKPPKIIGQYILCASGISSRVSPRYKSKEFLLSQLSRYR